MTIGGRERVADGVDEEGRTRHRPSGQESDAAFDGGESRRESDSNGRSPEGERHRYRDGGSDDHHRRGGEPDHLRQDVESVDRVGKRSSRRVSAAVEHPGDFVRPVDRAKR